MDSSHCGKVEMARLDFTYFVTQPVISQQITWKVESISKGQIKTIIITAKNKLWNDS